MDDLLLSLRAQLISITKKANWEALVGNHKEAYRLARQAMEIQEKITNLLICQ